MRYWAEIKIPFFPPHKKDEISKLYYNPVNRNIKNCTLQTFEANDSEMNLQAGILQIDDQIKILKNKLNEMIDMVIDNQKISVNFSFLQDF